MQSYAVWCSDVVRNRSNSFFSAQMSCTDLLWTILNPSWHDSRSGSCCASGQLAWGDLDGDRVQEGIRSDKVLLCLTHHSMSFCVGSWAVSSETSPSTGLFEFFFPCVTSKNISDMETKEASAGNRCRQRLHRHPQRLLAGAWTWTFGTATGIWVQHLGRVLQNDMTNEQKRTKQYKTCKFQYAYSQSIPEQCKGIWAGHITCQAISGFCLVCLMCCSSQATVRSGSMMFVFVMAQLVLTQCFGPQTFTIPELNYTMDINGLL